MLRRFAFWYAIVGVCLSTAAQNVPPPLVDSMGEATVYDAPTHVEFQLHRTAMGATLEAAMAVAETFGDALREQMVACDLHPTELAVRAPSIPDLTLKAVVVSARLRFGMASYLLPEKGMVQFALLCDTIGRVAGALGCTVTGPILGTAEKETLMYSAVTLATENAYPPADAAASALKSGIYSVDSVQVIEVLWNRPGELEAAPNIRQISCTARVKVSYALTGHE